jgi:hypothetical protein
MRKPKKRNPGKYQNNNNYKEGRKAGIIFRNPGIKEISTPFYHHDLLKTCQILI